MVGDLRDGVEFRLWAYRLVVPDLMAKQIAAVAELAKYPALSAADNVTIVQLDMHMNGLLQAWLNECRWQ